MGLSPTRTAQVVTLKSTVSRMASDSLAIDSQLRASRCSLDAAHATLAARDQEISGLRADVARLEQKLCEAHSRAQEDETLRCVCLCAGEISRSASEGLNLGLGIMATLVSYSTAL